MLSAGTEIVDPNLVLMLADESYNPTVSEAAFAPSTLDTYMALTL